MSDEPILAGAEPFFFKGNDIGVLVCHGFTGTTQSMRYLGEQLHGAGYTVTVSYTHLTLPTSDLV